MEDSCKDCGNWEEEIFWTHFQSIHFSQFLHADFLQRLEIPEKFAKNVKKRLPETVTLKGPSGVIWNVGVTEDDDTLFFCDGWKTFVKNHSLIENDFLIFKYNGVSHFDVLMFEGKSLCEKASSYFVSKCVHTESDFGYQTKRKVSVNPDEIVHNSSQCGLESSPEKSTNNDTDARPSRKATESAASNKKRIQNLGSDIRSIPAKRSLRGKEHSTFPGGVKVERFETGRSTLNTYSKHKWLDLLCFELNLSPNIMVTFYAIQTRDECFIFHCCFLYIYMILLSFRHNITQDSEYEHITTDGDVFDSLWHATGKRVATRSEKTNALIKAQEALSVEGFMVVMKPTHVDRKFYMSIPSAWVAKYISRAKADVILRMNERRWRTQFNYRRSRECGALSCGWRKFVKDNNIEEHDVCVFEPANIGSRPIILDVSIFHVLPAAVPHRRVNHPPSSPPGIVKEVDTSALPAGR